MVDSPKDPNSRWSGQHESPSIKQWILLRLDELSIIGMLFSTHPVPSSYGSEIRTR